MEESKNFVSAMKSNDVNLILTTPNLIVSFKHFIQFNYPLLGVYKLKPFIKIHRWFYRQYGWKLGRRVDINDRRGYLFHYGIYHKGGTQFFHTSTDDILRL